MRALKTEGARSRTSSSVVWSCVVVWATACGGTTKIGQQAVNDEGGGATSAVGGAGGGVAATGASGGFIVASGGLGAGASGGSIASGGSGGQQDLCLGSDGRLRSGLNRCSSDGDCGTLKITRCCGSDLVVGISNSTCVVPGVNCAGVDCAKFSIPTAEDGLTGTPISARCEAADSGQGTCRSFVVMQVDGGTATPCGAQTCSDNQVCALPPTNVPGQGSPYCVDIPPSCSASLTCDCFAPDVCGGGAKFCFSIAGREMQCLFAP